jgi:hypothetical protein
MYAIRQPKAAGVFYNSDRYSLERDIESFFTGKRGPKKMKESNIVGLITPHDKYHLCGTTCAWSFSRVEKANYVIIGTNHNGIGSNFSIMKEGLWKTPFGEIVIGNKVAEKILNKSKMIEYDVIPHEKEHSIEVQLPFLQYRFGNDFKIVPILVTNKFNDKDFINQCKNLGKAIAHSIMTEKEKWIIVATSDFSHGSKNKVSKLDKEIINSIKNLSENKFYETIQNNSSHICGYGTILTMLSAAKELKAERSKLLKYTSSIEVLKDPNLVTGYASILVY